MFEQMINGSRAVLLRPSAATFEEFEKDDLGAATVYVLVGSIITAVLGAIGFLVQRPALEQQFGELERQFGRPFPLRGLLVPQNITVPIFVNVLGALVGFFIFLAIVYLLGRAFGGSGAFGELAYDVALFWTPLSVLGALVNIFSIGLLACITAPIGLALAIYNLYLTYLSIRSGMNLPGNKALLVILTPVLIVVVLCCGLALFASILAGPPAPNR